MVNSRRNHTIALAALILTVIFWGFGFIFTDSILKSGLTPGFTNAVRFVTATVVVGSTFCKKIKLNRKVLLYGLIGGTALFGGFMLQLAGLQFTTPANNGFFTAAYILFVPFLAWIFNKKRPNIIVFFGVATALIGLFILNFGEISSSGENSGNWFGNLMTLAGSMFFAFQMAFSDYALKKTEAMSLTFMQLAVAAVMFVVYFFIFELSKLNFSSVKWSDCVFPLVFVAVLGTCFAYPAQINAQKYISPSETSLILSGESLVGAVLSVILGRDIFSWFIAVGGALVIAAVMLVEFVPSYLVRKRLRENAPENIEVEAPADVPADLLVETALGEETLPQTLLDSPTAKDSETKKQFAEDASADAESDKR